MKKTFVFGIISALSIILPSMSYAEQADRLPVDKQLSPGSQQVVNRIAKDLQKIKKQEQTSPERIVIDRSTVSPVALSDDVDSLDRPAGEAVAPFDISITQPVKGHADAEVLLDQAYQALVAGQYEVAISLYKQSLKHAPYNSLAAFGLATTYHRSGQLEEARAMYEGILKRDPGNKEALNNFLVLIAQEAPQDAILQLKKMEKIHPTYSPIQAQIGMIYANLDEHSKAVQHLEKAIAFSPENMTYRYNIAVLLDRMGHAERATQSYYQVLKAGLNGTAIPSSVAKIQERIVYLSKQQ